MPFDQDERDINRQRLTEFSELVTGLLSISEEAKDAVTDSHAALTYSRGVRNSSDLNSRRMRLAALDFFLRGVDYEAPQRQTMGLSKGSLPQRN